MNHHHPREHEDEEVLVIDSEPEQQALLAMCLPTGFHGVGGTISDLRHACAGGRGGLVVLGPSFADTDAIGEVGELQLPSHGLEGILIVEAVSTDLLRLGLDAGLREVLTVREAPVELEHAIVRLSTQRTRSDHRERLGFGSPGVVLAIAAAKGGTGVTTVSVNVAAELARRGHRVVLIDADLQFGDVAVAIGMHPGSTIVGAVEAGTNLSPHLLDTMLTVHGETGLRVLAAPNEPADADLVSPADVARVVEMARFLADIVIVDTPSALTPVALSILDNADRIGLVTVPALTVLHDTAVELALLKRLGLAARTQLVLNRSSPEHHASKRRIEHRLPVPVAGSIPESHDIVVAESRTTPVILSASRSKAAASFRTIVDNLAHNLAPSDVPAGALAVT